MSAGIPFVIALVALALLLAWWLMGDPAVTPRRLAVFVMNRVNDHVGAKLAFLSDRLTARARARGFPAVRAAHPDSGALLERTTPWEAGALRLSRSLGAEFALVVAVHDFDAKPELRSGMNWEKLRVHTTLCVTYQLLESATGRVADGQTIALCRKTPPIVAGTTVGSEVLEGLLDEAASRICRQLPLTRPAA